ncbi:MAG: hypothetical protein ACM338_06770 [Betaproteobacteria bacterium]
MNTMIPIADLQPIYSIADVVDDLRKFLALAVAGREAVQFTPMLLLGEPGLGKTYFAKRLAQTLIQGDYANPVVILDEIDKAGGDSRYDPMGALYGLLERLASVPPRDMRWLLLDALGTAQLAGRDQLVPSDIDSRKLCGRRARPGF